MKDYIGSERHREILSRAQIIASELKKFQKRQRILDYNKNPKKCQQCGCPIEYEKRRNTFCSSSCSASNSNNGRKRTDESKKKTSKTILSKSTLPKDRKCQWCGGKITDRRKRRRFCSRSCACSYRSEHPEEYEKTYLLHSRIQKARVFNGTHSGWKHRNKFAPSYPEKYFINVFDNWKTLYVREKKIGPYFIDFAIEDQMIAIEIDGKQHLYPDRIEHDKKKDLLLMSNGWQVIRIRWYNPINDKNRKLLYDQIENLKKILLSS